MDSVVWGEWKNFIDFLAMCFCEHFDSYPIQIQGSYFHQSEIDKMRWWSGLSRCSHRIFLLVQSCDMRYWWRTKTSRHPKRYINLYLNGELIFEPRWKREFIPLGEENLTGHVSGHWLPDPPKTSFPKLFHQLSSKFDFDHVWHPLGLSLFVFVFHNLSLSKIQSVFCFAQFSFTAKCCEFQFWRKSTQQFRLKFPYSVNQSIWNSLQT